MPVAKSYKDLPVCGDVYYKNKRAYIKVLKNGQEKEVRWYSESEYRKMYPELAASGLSGRSYGPQMKVLGFQDENDAITIFFGEIVKNEKFFEEYKDARYHKLWGWYLISDNEPCSSLPDKVIPIKVSWNLVGNDDGYLKTDEEIKKVITKIAKEIKAKYY